MIQGMHQVTRFAAVLLAGAALAGCKGGEGQDCLSAGPLGPLYCDDGLVCNEAAGDVCERARTRGENQPCSSNDSCTTDLWCDTTQMKCRAFLNLGDVCSNPFSCGPDAICGHDPVTRLTDCVPRPDGGATDANAGVDGSTDGAPPR